MEGKTSRLEVEQTMEQAHSAVEVDITSLEEAEQTKEQPRAAVVRVNILDLIEYDDNNYLATMKVFVEVSWQEPELLQAPDCQRNVRWSAFEEVPRCENIKKKCPISVANVLSTRLGNLVEDRDFAQYYEVKDSKDEPAGRFASFGLGSDVPILSWCAMGTGKFMQVVQFQSYPFDQQSIGVRVRMVDKRLEEGFRVLENHLRPCTLHDTNIEGWLLHKGPTARLIYHHENRERDDTITFSAIVCRAPMFYVVNFVIPPSFVTLLAMITFALPCDELADRSALICTMFLTQVAFKSTLTTYVPKVSYLTFLDKYIFLQSLLLIFAALTQTVTFIVQRDEKHPLTETVALGMIISVWSLALLSVGCKWCWSRLTPNEPETKV